MTVVAALVGGLLALGSPAAGTSVAYRGPSFPAVATIPTADKPQHKLWHHDGRWWGLLVNSAGRVTVHELGANHTWVDRGTIVDEDGSSRGDVLQAGNRVYVASTNLTSIEVTRLDYTASTRTWTKASGFPVSIGAGASESVTIARDSTGRLWVTFTQLSKVWVSHSTSSDSSWAQPFVPAVGGTDVTADDISAITTLPGRVALVWSNQSADAFYFASHADGSAPTAWGPRETARAGTGIGEDHINLAVSSEGRLYAAIKTSLNGHGSNPGDPLVEVLVRQTDGTWSEHPFGLVADNHTRPIVVLEEDGSRVHVFATAPEAGGSIYWKSSPTAAIAFAPGRGDELLSASGARINNVTTTRQRVSPATGLVVLAADSGNRDYYHAEISLEPPPPPPPPPTPESVVYVGAASASVTDATSIALRRPATTASGDVLVAAVAARGRPAVAAPAGWSPVRDDQNGNAMNVTTFVATVRPGDPDTDAFTLSSAQSAVGVVAAYRGADTAAPVDAHSGGVQDASVIITAPSASTVQAATKVVAVFATAWDSDITTAQDTVLRAQAQSRAGRYDVGAAIADQVGPQPAGVTGDRLAYSVQNRANVGQLVALRPAGTAPTPPPTSSPTPPSTSTPTPPPTSTPTPSPSSSPTPTPSPTSSPTPPPSSSPTPPPSPTPAPIIVLRAASSGANAEETTLVLPKPASTEPGDVLLASIDVRGHPTITPPEGWTLVREDENGYVVKKATYWKVAGADEPATFTWTFHKPQAASGVVHAYDGVDSAQPVESHSGSAGDPSVLVVAPTASGSGGSKLVAFFGIARATTMQEPPTMQRRAGAASAAGRYHVSSMSGDEGLMLAGPTGDRVATAGATGASNGHQVVLRAEGAT